MIEPARAIAVDSSQRFAALLVSGWIRRLYSTYGRAVNQLRTV
jgi:hypothetical protein